MHLADALVSDPEVGELGLQVRIQGQDLFVSGTVSTAARRRRVGQLMAELAPHLEVHNDTVVAEAPAPRGEERL